MLCYGVHDSYINEFYGKHVLFVLFLSCDFDQDDLLLILVCIVDESVLVEFERDFLDLGCFINGSFDVAKLLEDSLNIDRRCLRCVIFSRLYTFVDIIN